jgi:hypothetical protein
MKKTKFNTLTMPLTIGTSYGEFRLEPIEPHSPMITFVVTFRFRRTLHVTPTILKQIGNLTDHITHECLQLLDETSVRLK